MFNFIQTKTEMILNTGISLISSSMPGVHAAIHNGVVHGVAHCEPVDDQIDVVYVTVADDCRLEVLNDEVRVLR